MEYEYGDIGECDTCFQHFTKKYAEQKTCGRCFVKTPQGKAWAERKGDSNPGWNSGFADRQRQSKRAQGQGQQKAQPGAEEYAEMLRRAQQAENQRKYDEEVKKRAQREREQWDWERGQRNRDDPFGGERYWYDEASDPFKHGARDDPFEGMFRDQFKRQQQYTPPPRQQPRDLTLDADLLKKLIMLCHPDKHGGSELSNNVTKELLRMKGNVR